MIRGIIFDLDGTLVDSELDFDRMRREMGLEPGLPILETIAQLPEPRAAACREILARHELDGANRARLMPGVAEFLQAVAAKDIRQAVLTRNSRAMALATMDRLGLRFEIVMAREDAPAKPDPAAIWIICETWGLRFGEVLMLGDYHFDIEAGRRAGVRTALYTRRRPLHQLSFTSQADFHLHCFAEPDALLAWLAEPT